MRIKNKEMANTLLYRIAEIEKSLKERQAMRDEILNDTQKAWSEYAGPLQEELSGIIADLHEFTDANRSELLGDAKSCALANGTLGYRSTPESIEVSEKTADLLIKAGLDAMVQIKKTPVKAALKNLNDKELKRFAAKRVPGTENFYAKAIELKQSDTNPAA